MNSLGVNTYGYIWSTRAEECVQRLGGLGFQDFELVINPPHLSIDDDPRARASLRNAVRSAGARTRSVNLPSLDVNLASPVPRVRAWSVDMYRAALQLAADLEAPLLIVVPGRVNPLLAPDMASRRAWMRESLESLLPYAASLGVRLALENVPMASFPTAGTLGAFVREMGSKSLCVCYDAANAHYVGESPADGLLALRDLVEVVHVSDTGRAAWKHDEVGLGDVPFGEVARALSRMEYEGPCLMEIIGPDPEPAILRSQAALARMGFRGASQAGEAEGGR